MKNIFPLLLLGNFLLAQEHILITEFAVTPTVGEFIEITNNSDQTIDLSDYYVTDATFASGGTYYYNIVTGSNSGGGGFADFNARFPAGSSIAPGEFQTIAMNGSDFLTTYGQNPTYELYETNATIPNMREALPGSINNQGGLTDNGEVIIIYYWNGQTDLVQDIDYVLWGDKVEAVDKTNISIDGPDLDSTPSTYSDDTAIPQQQALVLLLPDDLHAPGESVQRSDLIEADENHAGGNGLTGHDETSENLPKSFIAGTPNPGTGPTVNKGPVIANIIQDPEFPASSDIVTVSTDVTDDGQVVSVRLFTSLNAAPYDSSVMNLISGNTYSASIDSQATGTDVSWYIKAEDNDGFITISSTFSYTVARQDTITPIAAIQTDIGFWDGRQVTISGVVTIGAGILITTRTTAYVQDNSGYGIQIFSFDPPDASLVRGNQVLISGTVENYQGLVTEITDYSLSVLSTDNDLPSPLSIATGEANSLAREGTYVEIQAPVIDKYAAGGGTNIIVNDGSGAVTIRIWDSAGLDLNAITVGKTIVARGVIGEFSGSGQLLVAYQEDIFESSGSSSADGTGLVSVQPDSIGINAPASLLFTAAGTLQDTVTTISITIPENWLWSGSQSDVVLSGDPFDLTTVAINGKGIVLNDVGLTSTNSGVIELKGLTAPGVDSISTFIFKTAGRNGTLKNIAEQPTVKVGKGTGKTVTPIADIQTDIGFWDGKQVTISGVVTIGAGILITTRTTAYVQDNSGYGIQIFSFDPPDADLVRGNQVLISGTVENYQGLVTEITDYSLSVLQKGADLPEPLKINTSEAQSLEREGTFVEIQATVIDKYAAGGGTNIIVDDGSGEVTLRIWDSANLDLGDFNPGDGIVARGVIGEFSGAGQILVAYQEDISPLELPKAAFSLKVPNKPFAPDRGEKFPVNFSAGDENSHIVLRIYDLGGRLITTLVDEQGKSFEQLIEWNGRNQLNEMVPLGAYILHLQVTSNSDGSTQVATAPIVVGTVLKF